MRRLSPSPLPITDAMARARQRTVGSRPSRRLALAVCSLLLAVFAGVAALPFALAMAPDTAERIDEPWVVLLLMALLLLGAAGCWLVARQMRRKADAELVVSDLGLVSSALPGWPAHMAWSELRPRPDAHVDVSVVMTAGEGVSYELRVHVAEATGHAITERRLPLAALSWPHLVFGNVGELRLALLLQLATAPATPLRLDREVFLHFGIDPETWQPMAGPRWVRRLLVLLALVPAVLWIVRPGSMSLPVWQMVGSAVLALVCGALAATLLFEALYPRLHGAPWQYVRAQRALSPSPSAGSAGGKSVRKGQPRSSARR